MRRGSILLNMNTFTFRIRKRMNTGHIIRERNRKRFTENLVTKNLKKFEILLWIKVIYWGTWNHLLRKNLNYFVPQISFLWYSVFNWFISHLSLYFIYLLFHIGYTPQCNLTVNPLFVRNTLIILILLFSMNNNLLTMNTSKLISNCVTGLQKNYSGKFDTLIPLLNSVKFCWI